MRGLVARNSPMSIAVAVVAEMISRRRNPATAWNSLSKSVFAQGTPEAVRIDPSEIVSEAELKEAELPEDAERPARTS